METAQKIAGSEGITTEIVEMGNVAVAPCRACEACAQRRGECAIRDGFQDLRDRWVKSDVVIYSVPVYHLNIPGQLKCFLDRLGMSQRRVYEVPSQRRLKVVGVISQGSHLFAGQELAIAFLHQHAVLMNCIPVSGDGWESYLGASGWTRNQKALNAIEQEYQRGEMDAQVAVRACETLARRCIEMAWILRAGFEVLRERFSADPAYRAYFDRR
jgi:multimeric flavodoxin WrbA